MRGKFYVVIMFSIVLLFAGTTSLDARSTKVTAIILNQVPTSAYFGDELKVTGKLIEAATGEGIANAEIKIIDNKPSGQEVLVTTKTRKYGLFTATWNASLDDPRDRTMHLRVKYDGSADYTASISREHTIMIRLLPLEIKFQYLKSFYKQGESIEIIFTVTSLQKPVEPDILRTNFNSKPVTVTAYGKGNYVYETEPLAKGHNQFFVSALKDGYKTVSRIITITVN